MKKFVFGIALLSLPFSEIIAAENGIETLSPKRTLTRSMLAKENPVFHTEKAEKRALSSKITKPKKRRPLKKRKPSISKLLQPITITIQEYTPDSTEYIDVEGPWNSEDEENGIINVIS